MVTEPRTEELREKAVEARMEFIRRLALLLRPADSTAAYDVLAYKRTEDAFHEAVAVFNEAFAALRTNAHSSAPSEEQIRAAAADRLTEAHEAFIGLQGDQPHSQIILDYLRQPRNAELERLQLHNIGERRYIDGSRVRELRLERGYESVVELAHDANLDPAYVGKLEREVVKRPEPFRVWPLARFLGVGPDGLFRQPERVGS